MLDFNFKMVLQLLKIKYGTVLYDMHPDIKRKR
jgi:hypothetical protein